MTPLNIQPASSYAPHNPGVWAGVPMEDYHRSEGYSASQLAILANNPRKFLAYVSGEYRTAETKDMQLGTIIHSLLSGEPISACYYQRPETYGDGKKFTMAAKECKAWAAAHADKPILGRDDVETLEELESAAKTHAKFTRLLSSAVGYELSMTYRNPSLDAPYMLRFRPDVVGHDREGYWILDNKSTRDASTEAFAREMLRRQYHVQFALYKRGLERLVDAPVRFYVCAVEKAGKFSRMNLRRVNERALEKGGRILDERLAMLKRFRSAQWYPEFPDDEGTEHIQNIDLPDYTYDDDEMLEGMEETTNE